MVSKTGMVRGFLLVAEDFRVISPCTTVMPRVEGGWEKGAAVTVNANSWPGTLVLRTAEKALVLLCGSERASGAAMRLKMLSTCVLALVASGWTLKVAMAGATSMGSQTTALM